MNTLTPFGQVLKKALAEQNEILTDFGRRIGYGNAGYMMHRATYCAKESQLWKIINGIKNPQYRIELIQALISQAECRLHKAKQGSEYID